MKETDLKKIRKSFGLTPSEAVQLLDLPNVNNLTYHERPKPATTVSRKSVITAEEILERYEKLEDMLLFRISLTARACEAAPIYGFKKAKRLIKYYECLPEFNEAPLLAIQLLKDEGLKNISKRLKADTLEEFVANLQEAGYNAKLLKYKIAILKKETSKNENI